MEFQLTNWKMIHFPFLQKLGKWHFFSPIYRPDFPILRFFRLHCLPTGNWTCSGAWHNSAFVGRQSKRHFSLLNSRGMTMSRELVIVSSDVPQSIWSDQCFLSVMFLWLYFHACLWIHKLAFINLTYTNQLRYPTKRVITMTYSGRLDEVKDSIHTAYCSFSTSTGWSAS